MRQSPDIDRATRERAGFTLVELLVSMTIVALLVVFLGQMIGQATNTWTRGEGNKERLQNVRAVTDFIGNELSAALLPVNRTDTNNLQLIVNSTALTAATYNNHDTIFWQTPLATEQTLGDVAETGYFVQWDTSHTGNPRAQLCRFFCNPTLSNGTGGSAGSNPSFLIYSKPTAWLTNAVVAAVAPANQANSYQGLFAENVVGLWTQCLDPNGVQITKDAGGGTFVSGGQTGFDSRRGYQYTDNSLSPAVLTTKAVCALPAAIDLSLVMLDSESAARIGAAQKQEIVNLYANPAVTNGDTFVTQALTDATLRPVRSGLRSYHVRIFLQNSK